MSDALEITWASCYRTEWDEHPHGYVDAGRVAWGRSRRLAKAVDPARAFKAYLGIQAFDPGQWRMVGEPEAKFFLSLFVSGRTITLRTFPTCAEALAALLAFHERLPMQTRLVD